MGIDLEHDILWGVLEPALFRRHLHIDQHLMIVVVPFQEDRVLPRSLAGPGMNRLQAAEILVGTIVWLTSLRSLDDCNSGHNGR